MLLAIFSVIVKFSKSQNEDRMTIALIGFAALLVLSFLRVPIAFTMIIVGFFGMVVVNGWEGALANVGQTAFDSSISYELSVVPLFILMGNFVTKARLSEELYTASNAFLGHLRGGLAMATVVACGGFSAVCGSSLATAATMSKVAMPSMRKFGYDDGLAAGSIAAGGTLGILIPPSVLLVIYGILTQTSIGKLFAAGIIPGIIGILFYLAAVKVMIKIKNPWDLAYELNKEYYSRADIDDMLFCEVEELINQE